MTAQGVHAAPEAARAAGAQREETSAYVPGFFR
jgi:hypothetical protein